MNISINLNDNYFKSMVKAVWMTKTKSTHPKRGVIPQSLNTAEDFNMLI